MLQRPPPRNGPLARALGLAHRAAGDVVRALWAGAVEVGAIGPRTRAGRRFGAFGENSVICFPATTLFGERWIRIGSNTIIGPYVTLSALMSRHQVPVRDPVISIGDRCLIGRGSGIVGHLGVHIGHDVWTGHFVYITDQNHGYEDVSVPIGRQAAPEREVTIGDGSWLGHGTIVLPGARIGRHVVVAAGSVVTGWIPDYCVAAGAPARPVRRFVPGEGWSRVGRS